MTTLFSTPKQDTVQSDVDTKENHVREVYEGWPGMYLDFLVDNLNAQHDSSRSKIYEVLENHHIRGTGSNRGRLVEQLPEQAVTQLASILREDASM